MSRRSGSTTTLAAAGPAGGSGTTSSKGEATVLHARYSLETPATMRPKDGPDAHDFRPTSEFIRVQYPQPHWRRKAEILAAHPEVGQLMGYDVVVFVWTLVLVAGMFLAAYLLREQPMWLAVVVGYAVGAVVDHALWVHVHEYTHNLVLPGKLANRVGLLICNLPHLWPSAVAFRHYHLQHHAHLNEAYGDPDVPGEWEQRLLGTTSIGKIIYLLTFPLLQTLRTARYTTSIVDIWLALNWIVNLSLTAYIFHAWGFTAILFLAVASYFSIGLHPVGGRWIAEHFAVHPTQETYSYYGPINQVAFNIGYHNEHHDVPEVPCLRLPQLTQIAKEYYEPLYQHPSYLLVLAQFFLDPKWTLQTRVVRDTTTKM